MNFYASLIFFGIILVIFSLVWIALDKKKVFKFIQSFDRKKEELSEIITDAEQMIEELNKFSDYIVSQMDVKNEELQANLKNAEANIDNISKRAQAAADISSLEAAALSKTPVLNQAAALSEAISAEEVSRRAVSSRKAIGTAVFEETEERMARVVNGTSRTVSGIVLRQERPEARKKDNIIPLNKKYAEALRLSEKGMDAVEIAKTLYMGKGEVELLLDINRN